jgi:hypothetical protein
LAGINEPRPSATKLRRILDPTYGFCFPKTMSDRD